MTNYFSKKVKTTPNNKLSSNRDLFLNLEQVEPSLGYPGEKPIKESENYYNLITTDNSSLSERFWVSNSDITSVNGISIFKDGLLSGPANNIDEINFSGNILSASASGNISTITATVNVSGSNLGEVVFTDTNDFTTSTKLYFNSSVGILTVSDGIFVKDWFGTTINGVGIGPNYSPETLYVDGNALFVITESEDLVSDILTVNTIKATYLIDVNDSAGNINQILSSTGAGVSWTSNFTTISGDWGGQTGIRTDNVTYTNTTGSLLYVSATPGIDRIAEGLTESQIAGSYSIAEVDGIEVARTRDNGTANTEFLFMNVDFFVPNGSSYNVKVYNTFGTQWISSITTYSWSEFEF